MAIIKGGTTGALAEIDSVMKALRVVPRALDWGTLGHYRYAVRINSTAAQAANARILELRNPSATVLVIPTRLTIRALQTAAGTAQENSLDVFKCTGFTAVDTTNTVTPTLSVKRGSMNGTPTSIVRHLNPAAAGMTGGTLTKDASSFATFPFLVEAAIPTTGNTGWGPYEVFDDVNGTHPFVLGQNEGIEVENRVLNVTSYGITWYLDFSFAEVSAY